MNWIHPTADGCTVTVKATPRDSRSEIVGPDADRLRVRLQAPPVDGKANAALIALFSDALGIPKRSVEILTGDTSRLKRIRLRGVTADAAATALSARL